MHLPNYWPADGSLPEHVAKFLEWLLTPKWERNPPTQVGWARENGFSEFTVSAWKKEPRFIKAFEARARELNISVERKQRVMDAVFKEAENGDMNAAKLWLQHADALAPKRIVIEDHTIANMTDEELTQRLAQAGLLPTND